MFYIINSLEFLKNGKDIIDRGCEEFFRGNEINKYKVDCRE